jgi:xanthine dehydrogenase YagS FAD-binding subunit
MKGLKNGVYEVRQRHGLDWPMVAAAVAYAPGGSISDARVVLGHVAPVPWRSNAAEGALNGKSLSGNAAAAAGAAAAQGANPLSMNGYKVQQVKVAVKRAVMAASA